MSGLTLLASYPKSGNTWMRAFLASVRRNGRPPDINADLEDMIALASRKLHDRLGDIDSTDFTRAEIFRLRPFVSRQAAVDRPGLYKVHDGNSVPSGAEEPAIPSEAIDRVVYIARDPRDVAVSAAHHFGRPIERVVADMGDERFALGRSDDGFHALVDQHVGDWSGHVAGWIDAPGLAVHLVRYEDMKAEPESTFGAVCDFLEWTVDIPVIRKAVEVTRFERLAAQEKTAGFGERFRRADRPFFREGQAGGWRRTLAPHLAERIVERHGPMMGRLGYI